MRFLITAPILVFLASCFVTMAVALGLDMAIVTNILMVAVGIFGGVLISAVLFGRQWRPAHEAQDKRDVARTPEATGPAAVIEEREPLQESEPAGSDALPEVPCGVVRIRSNVY